MAERPILATSRLILRRWQSADLEPFADLNADPVVMEYLPSPLTREESDEFVDRIEWTFEEEGFGLWALEHRVTGQFLGFAGLWPARFEAHFTPAIEVGWRLARDHWGNGYATEAARAAMSHGFTQLGIEEIVSFTALGNVRSARVMERLGMSRRASEDFDHPALEVVSPLRRHALYRMKTDTWASINPG